VAAPPAERLRGKGRYGVLAVKKLCDPYLIASETCELLTMGRYINLCIFVHLLRMMKISWMDKISNKEVLAQEQTYIY